MARCSYCEQDATIHSTELEAGAWKELHYCSQHANRGLGEGFIGQVFAPFSWTAVIPLVMERLRPILEELGLAEDQLRTSQAVPAYLRLLKDQDWRLRYVAAVWLEYLGPEAADAAADLRAALQDENEYVRMASEAALRKTGS